eukprot:gene5560-5797_t
MTEGRLKQLLLTDKDLKVSTATNRLLYSCSFGSKPPPGGAAHVHSSSSRGADTGMATAAGAVQVMANGQLPSDPDPPPGMWNTLHSRPGSSKTFYLDFTGCQVPRSIWNTNGVTVRTTPFDLDNQTNTNFSPEEQAAMIQIWRAVAADFHDLDVDVTTESPPLGKLYRTAVEDQEYGMRVCIGGYLKGYEDAGGVGWLNSFSYWTSDLGSTNWGYQSVWVFSPGLSNDLVAIAVAASHEIGHSLGLEHDGCIQNGARSEYYDGTDDWGSPYFSRTATFDRGEYPCTTNPYQIDYQTMTRSSYLSFVPPAAGGASVTDALRLCSSTNSSICTLTDSVKSVLTATVTSQISLARSGAATDRKLFAVSVRPGLTTASVEAVPPINRCDGVMNCAAEPSFWVRSNLNWQLSILNASGNVVAGPVGSTILEYNNTFINGTLYIQVTPTALPTQPSLYGVGGYFDLSVTFPEGTGNILTLNCPTVGLPACVVPTGYGDPSCTANTTQQFCVIEPESGRTCRYAYKTSSTICRPATGVCDEAEACTGISSDCPADAMANTSRVRFPASRQPIVQQ